MTVLFYDNVNLSPEIIRSNHVSLPNRGDDDLILQRRIPSLSFTMQIYNFINIQKGFVVYGANGTYKVQLRLLCFPLGLSVLM